MPDDATGAYFLPSSYFVQTGDDVLPTQHNPPFEDIASALGSRLHADGRRAWAGPQNANGYKITGLADGTASTDAATVGQAVVSAVPIGAVLDWAGATSPSRYMLCHGQAISRSTYSDLFAVIGTTYGAGDGSSTFNLPDCRGRVNVGKDDMGGTAAGRVTAAGVGVSANVLGATGGAQNIILTSGSMPAHSHIATASVEGWHTHTGGTSVAGSHGHEAWTGTAGLHGHPGSIGSAGEHSHGGVLRSAGITGSPVVSAGVLGTLGATDGAGAHTHPLTIEQNGDHSHSVGIGTNGSHSHSFSTDGDGNHSHIITVQNAGGDGGHNNVQPCIVFNKIIRVQ